MKVDAWVAVVTGEAIEAEAFLVLPHSEVLEFFPQGHRRRPLAARHAPPAGHGVARLSAAGTGRSALLVDFGGVLTTSIHDAFRAYARKIGDDPELVLRLLAQARSPPEACVMVDDVQHNLDRAERIGIEGVLHRTAPQTLAALDARFGLRPAA